MNQRLRFNLILGACFILAGVLMNSQRIIDSFRSHRSTNGPALVSSTVKPDTKTPLISGEPERIDIPAVDISVDVEPGTYDKKTQTWTLSLIEAEYATMTALPNNREGNTFIYGHNRWEVFYKLLKVQNGDQAIISTSNGHKFYYHMIGMRTTKPDDVSLFSYQGPPILTLQTCSGLWYQNRNLYVFKFDQVL